jgi:transcriptional regulator of arginine metabolism
MRRSQISRAQRQAILLDLVTSTPVRSQAEAVRLLAERGIRATQATVSRDLDELGAVKVRAGGGSRYALVDAVPAFGASLGHVLRDFVVTASASGNLAVLRTPPGHASVVAAALDRAQLDGVLGTVAGDDTLFVCADERTGGAGVLNMLDRAMRRENR